MHQCKDYHLQYLPIVLGIVSIISIFTGAGCFLGVALAVLGIALSIVGLVLTLLIVIGFIAIMVAFCFA